MGNNLPLFLDQYEDIIKNNLIFIYNSLANPNEKTLVEYNHLHEIMKYNYLFVDCSKVFYEISYDEIVFLSTALKTNTCLVKLDLSQTKLTDDLLIHLIENGVKHLLTIQHLNFSHNMITCRGIKHLANFLTYNTKITRLDISSNRMAADGMIGLSGMITLNRTLRYLNIFNNKQTKEDNIYFYDRLFKNYSILYFRTNIFTTKELVVIKKIIERNIALYQGAFTEIVFT